MIWALLLFLISCQEPPDPHYVYSTDTLHVHIGQSVSTPQLVISGNWGFDLDGEDAIWVFCKLYNSFDNTLVSPEMFGSIYTDGDYTNLVDRDSSLFYQTVSGVGDTSEWVKYLEPDSVAFALVYLYPPSWGAYFYSAWVEWH